MNRIFLLMVDDTGTLTSVSYPVSFTTSIKKAKRWVSKAKESKEYELRYYEVIKKLNG